MPFSTSTLNALREILSSSFDDAEPPHIHELYREAGFDRAGEIFWKRPANELWADILRLHGPDVEVLIESIEEGGSAGVARKLRAALTAPATSSAARTVRRLVDAHVPITEHLHLDRAEQWARLQDATRSPPVSIYLLGGSRGLGHKFFLDRIRGQAAALQAVLCLDVYPAAVERPSKVEHALAGLRDILREDDVGAALQRGLAEGNVILLHRPVSLAEDAKVWLPVYAGTVLPALLEIIATARAALPRRGPEPGTLVIVLPIEWKERGEEFRTLLRAIRAQVNGMEILAPKELQAITEADVSELLYRITRRADVEDRAKKIFDDSGSTAEIFANLEEELRRMPRGSPS